MILPRLWSAAVFAPALEGGADPAAAGEPEITKEIAAQYFSGAYSRNRTAWHRFRRTLDLIRIAVIVVGIAVCTAAVYLTWRETGVGDLNKLYAGLGQRAFMLFTGALIAAIGAIPPLWRSHWQLPVGVFALGMAIEMALIDLGYRPLAIAMFLVAAGAIVYSYLLPRARQPLEDKELEPKLDRWIESVSKQLIGKTELPARANVGGSESLVLKTFPKRERSGAVDVLCKIGQDKRPRITPLGVAAFELGPQTMVVFEGAVDLRSEAVLYARVHEFRYEDVIALLWTREAMSSPRAGAPGAASAGRAAMQAVGAKPTPDPTLQLRHRDVLEIRLISGRTVSLVFSDTEFLPAESLKKGPVQPIEDMTRIRRIWQDIMQRQETARAGGRGSGLNA